MVSRAAICSELRWMPNSAAKADPACPTSMRAASTGAISRTKLKETKTPSKASEPKRLST